MVDIAVAALNNDVKIEFRERESMKE